MARALARKGVRVALLARNAEQLKIVHSSLAGDGHRIIQADLNDLHGLNKSVQELLKVWGKIEILVCNSGGPKAGPLVETQDEEFLHVFRCHLLASHNLVRLLSPGMINEGFGRIINIISTSVKIPIPNLGVSNTIRGAVANWSKTLSLELGPYGITVNNVLPGFTLTERLQGLLENASKARGLPMTEIQEEWLSTVPVGRFAKPEETAEAVVFLASPQASYINGINLPVDGGRTGSL